MPLLDEKEMKADYDKKVRDHKKQVASHSKQPASTRGKAPPKPRKPHQQYACFCYKLHCNNMDNGNGCYACEDAALDSDSSLFVKTDKCSNYRQCVCSICQCQCSKTFKEADRQKIATARLIEEK
jgi:hypothetical protein